MPKTGGNSETGRKAKALPCEAFLKSRTEQSVFARTDLASTIKPVILDRSKRTVKQVQSNCHPIHATVGA